MSAKPLEVTDTNFEAEVIKAETPVLVDFWAPWCPPCRIVGPIVEEIAEEMEGKLKVCKVNVDQSPGVAQSYEIRAVPTLILFKDGKAVKRMVGALPKDHLAKEIEAGLK